MLLPLKGKWHLRAPKWWHALWASKAALLLSAKCTLRSHESKVVVHLSLHHFEAPKCTFGNANTALKLQSGDFLERTTLDVESGVAPVDSTIRRVMQRASQHGLAFYAPLQRIFGKRLGLFINKCTRPDHDHSALNWAFRYCCCLYLRRRSAFRAYMDWEKGNIRIILASA